MVVGVAAGGILAILMCLILFGTAAIFVNVQSLIEESRKTSLETRSHVRRLSKELPEFAEATVTHVQYNDSLRSNIRLLGQGLTVQAIGLLGEVKLRREDLLENGFTPERLGPVWGTFFNVYLRPDLTRVILRG
ncbi:MAG: hypothetical protein FJX47_05750 [Alphaproteobacteria bacterium]|nr:hypothetical protein [Alphaproteobacteria bacterium]